MRIAIIGTGRVGSVLGTRWSQNGHRVTYGTRHPGSPKVQELVRQSGSGARALLPAEAAQASDVITLATPWFATESIVKSLGDLTGKVVLDCTNPIGPNFTLAVGHTTSAAEKIAEWAPGAMVAKAFSTTGAQNMANPAYGKRRLAMFVCSDDDQARNVACSLADELGFEAINCGPLQRARLLEPMALTWVTLAYSQGLGPDFGFALLRR